MPAAKPFNCKGDGLNLQHLVRYILHNAQILSVRIIQKEAAAKEAEVSILATSSGRCSVHCQAYIGSYATV